MSTTKTSVTAKPRYFSSGAHVIDIKTQMSILQSVTGKDPYLDPVIATSRASLWKGWYSKQAIDSRKFIRDHLPAIASKYILVWDLEGILDAQEVMPQHFLYRIGDQIRNLIHCSNLAPTKQLRSSGFVVLESSVDTNPEECYAQSNPSKTISRDLPSSLKTLELSKVTTIELAAIEHCLSLQHQGIPLPECS